MQLGRFTKWLKDAAKIKRLRVNERKSGHERYIRFGDLEKLDTLDATFFD
jgi:hypothetical protein